MPDFDEALSQIAEIRSQIATSTRFKGFAAAPFVAAAVICALIALVQDFAAQSGHFENVSFVDLWGIVLAGVTLMVAVEGYSRAIREHGQLADLMLGTTIRRLAPFGLTMAMIAYVICSEVPESAWMIPGIWLILMGLAGFATAASLPRSIYAASLWFFTSGFVVLITAASSKVSLPWMMGIPLTVGHGLVAFAVRSPRQSTCHD